MRHTLLAIVFIATGFSQSLPPQASSTGPLLDRDTQNLRGPWPPAGQNELYTQMQGIPAQTSTVTSQDITDSAVKTFGADDFTVPATVGSWQIKTIRVDGNYWNGDGPAENVNVFFFNNSGFLPDNPDPTQALAAFWHIAYTDYGTGGQTGKLEISLPQTLELAPGRYWVCVQVVMSFASGGQWGWTEAASGSSPFGFESAWMQNEDPPTGFPSNCDANQWGRRVTDCGQLGQGPPAVPDFAFAVAGTALTPQIIATPSHLTTSESGGSDTFSVTLSQAPSAEVTVPIQSSDTGEGTVSPAELVFNQANWSTPQTGTVQGVDDPIADGDQNYQIQVGPSTSSQAAFNGMTAVVLTATNQDNDAAAIEVNPVTGLITSESGTQQVFQVRLATQPTGTVTIPLTSDDTTEGSLPSSSIAFDSGNWHTWQNVTVQGVDDSLCDGTVPYSVTVGPATSSDTGYDGLNGPPVSLENLDNDIVTLPDPVLKSFLIVHFDGSDGSSPDGLLSTCEAELITLLEYHASSESDQFTDLTGLEALTNLTSINCSGNAITLVPDLSQLTLLASIDLSDNALAEGFTFPATVTSLNCAENLIASFASFPGASAVDQLFLQGNLLNSLTFLTGAPGTAPNETSVIDLRYNLLTDEDHCSDLQLIALNSHPNAELRFDPQGRSFYLLPRWHLHGTSIVPLIDSVNNSTWSYPMNCIP